MSINVQTKEKIGVVEAVRQKGMKMYLYSPGFGIHLNSLGDQPSVELSLGNGYKIRSQEDIHPKIFGERDCLEAIDAKVRELANNYQQELLQFQGPVPLIINDESWMPTAKVMVDLYNTN